jgi:hypothetical protein
MQPVDSPGAVDALTLRPLGGVLRATVWRAAFCEKVGILITRRIERAKSERLGRGIAAELDAYAIFAQADPEDYPAIALYDPWHEGNGPSL